MAVENWVSRHGAFIEWVRPDAGALCCVRLKREVFDAAGIERFYATLTKFSARVAPGPWFEDDPWVFRLGFGLPALTHLAIALECVSVALVEGSADGAGV